MTPSSRRAAADAGGGTGLALAIMVSAVMLAGCGAQGSTAPTASRSPSTSSDHPAAAASSGTGRCATSQLRFALGALHGAAGSEIQTINLTNAAATPCYLGGYAGVELLDANGQRLQDAQRKTTTFFGTYPPPHRVDIPPAGTTTFDLSWSGVDPCGPTVRAQRGTSYRITPPNDFDSAMLAAGQIVVCPDSLTVSPVGSRASTG